MPLRPDRSLPPRRRLAGLLLATLVSSAFAAGCGAPDEVEPPPADETAPPVPSEPTWEPPADGELTGEQVELFVAVRRAARARASTAADWPAAVEAALAETGADADEYAWIEATIVGTLADASLAAADAELEAEVAATAEALGRLAAPERASDDEESGGGEPSPTAPPSRLADELDAYLELAAEEAPAAEPEPVGARNLALVRSRLGELGPLLVGDEVALLPSGAGGPEGDEVPAPPLPEEPAE